MIRKPDEHDPDYECDATGHYRLAIQDLVWRLSSENQELAWRWAQTPLGGYRPLPHARKFHRCRKRFRHILGGNRGGKSQSLAIETLWRAMGMHPFRSDVPSRPTVGWWATTTFDKVSDTLWDQLDPSKGGLLVGLDVLGFDWEVIWRSKQHGIPDKLLIHLPNNGGTSQIGFKAYEQGRESFQAVGLDYAHFDEQYRQDVFIETVSRIGAGKAMEFADAFTPLNPDQWLEGRTYANVPATDAVFNFVLDDNRDDWGGFIPADLIAATIENWPLEVRETRRNGRWGAFLGSIYQSFNRDIHVLSEEQEKKIIYRDGRFPVFACSGSIDWGGANPFVFIWAIRIPHLDGDWYVFDEYYWDNINRGGRRLEEHAAEILARTAKWGLQFDRIWADHDPTNALEMNHYGVYSQPAQKDVLLGIEHMQTLFNPRRFLSNPDFPDGRPRLLISSRCENLIREIPTYRWKEGTDRQDAKNEPKKMNDHALDACRYLLFSEKPYDGIEAQELVVEPGRYRREF